MLLLLLADPMIQTLSQHFNPKPNPIGQRFKLHQRYQQPGESISTFLAALRNIVKFCDFGGSTNDRLCDQLVFGVRDKELQKKLLTISDLTLNQAQKFSEDFEAATKDAAMIGKGTGTFTSSVQADAVKQPARKETKGPGSFSKVRCYCCGNYGHIKPKCNLLNTAKCQKCHKMGHVTKMCFQPKKFQPVKKKANAIQSEDAEERVDTATGPGVVPGKRKPVVRPYVSAMVNGTDISFKLDTAADVSIVNKATWIAMGKPKLQPSSGPLRSYSEHSLEVMGECFAKVKIFDQVIENGRMAVVSNGGNLFGLNWIHQVDLPWDELFPKKASNSGSQQEILTVKKSVHPIGLDKLLCEFSDLFKDEMGYCSKLEAKVHLKPDAEPKFFKPRPVPYSMQEKVGKELDRLEKNGIIEKIDFSDWAAPTVDVIKPSGALRMCADFKVTINPQINVDQYPLPTPEDLFNRLRGGKFFTKLDMREAYSQLPVHIDSQKYLVINTIKGLYKYKRLPFGISSAPAIFQRMMDQAFQGLKGMACYLDDIIITGGSEKEHWENLNAVFQRARDYGFRFRMEKCDFYKAQIEYLGHMIDANGIHPSPKKVDAIRKMVPPTNVGELRAFLGFVNYFGKFLKSLSDKPHLTNC